MGAATESNRSKGHKVAGGDRGGGGEVRSRKNQTSTKHPDEHINAAVN